MIDQIEVRLRPDDRRTKVEECRQGKEAHCENRNVQRSRRFVHGDEEGVIGHGEHRLEDGDAEVELGLVLADAKGDKDGESGVEER